MNTPRIGGLLNAIARGVVHQIDQKLIDTQQLLAGIGNGTVVLVKLIAGGGHFIPFFDF